MKKILLGIACCIWINTIWAQGGKASIAKAIDESYGPYTETAKEIQNTLKKGGSVSAQELEKLSELYNQMIWFVQSGLTRSAINFYRIPEGDTLFSYRPSVENMLDAYKEQIPGDNIRTEMANRCGDWTAFEPDIPYYIPLYDRQSGKIVSCLILCAGIDGKIDNKINPDEKIYTDEWKKKIKAYNMVETSNRGLHDWTSPETAPDYPYAKQYKETEFPGGITCTMLWPLSVEDLLNGGKDLILHVGSNIYVNRDGSTKWRLKE